MNFADWLQGELDRRGWKQANLVRLGVNSSYISQVLGGTRNPGPLFCRQIAQALNLPDVEIFERAGLLNGLPQGDADVDEYVRLRLPLLSVERQKALLSYLDHLVERDRAERAIERDLETLDDDSGA